MTRTLHEIETPQVGEKLLIHIKPTRLQGNEFGTLQISIQSEVFDNFFNSIEKYKGKYEKTNIKDYCYVMTKAVKPDGSPIYLKSLDKVLNNLNGSYKDDFCLTDFITPNMSMLTAVGLKEGIDFVFKGIHSEQVVNNVIEGLYKKAKLLFTEYLQELGTEFTTYIKEVR